MRVVKGFTVVAAFFVVAATILAQPILLEINTNFIAHKLEPAGNLSARNIEVHLPKAFAKPTFSIPKSVPLISMTEMTHMGYAIFSVPEKSHEVMIKGLKTVVFVFPKELHYKSALKVSSPLPHFAFKLPERFTFRSLAPLEKVRRNFEGFSVENLNISKGIHLSILPYESKKRFISSLKILEMKKKVTAYSPLGGLETIGKFIREDRYAFWITPKEFGMDVNTSLISNWVVYKYTKRHISNLSSSFRSGPISTLFSMREGNVRAEAFTYGGISFGTEISSESTVSLFAKIPISIGNFRATVGGEYVTSSPTQFKPNITLKYDMEGFSPYISYGYEGATPTMDAGLITNVLSADGRMSLNSTPTMRLLVQYFSPVGIIGTGLGMRNDMYWADIRTSSKPFGFDVVQFSADATAHVESSGAYNVSGKLNMDFNFFSSYIQTWASVEFNGSSPRIFYGMEASF